MHMFMSGTPRNDPYQVIEDRLNTHRLFSMHGAYEGAVLRWLDNVRNGIFSAEAYFDKYPKHRDLIIGRDNARRENQKNIAWYRKGRDWDTAELIEHICAFTGERTYPRTILLDSGAFTAWNKGEGVTVDDVLRKYNAFMANADGLFDNVWMINLDKIPGERGRDPTQAELDEAVVISDRNFEILEKEFGHVILPVFHQGESDARLLENIDQVRGNSNYICVSPRNDVAEKSRVMWSNECHEKIAQMAPEIITHGLATTGNNMIREVPWYSGDSAAWVQHGGYGMIDVLHIDDDAIVPGRPPRYKNYFMSMDGVAHDVDPTAAPEDAAEGGRVPIGGKIGEKAKHYDACAESDQRIIDRRIEHYGFFHEVARWDSRVRNLICMGELGAYSAWAATIETRKGRTLLPGFD